MHRITGILLLVIYLSILLKPVFPVFNYQINKKGFLEKCINKDNSSLKCEGRCQLVLELKKSKSSNSPSFHVEEISSEDVSYLHTSFIDQSFVCSLSDPAYGFYLWNATSIFLLSEFHPPSV